MRQGKLLRSDALTCGPPKLDDDCWSPEGLGLVRSSARIFIACPGEHACRAAQLYADGEAHMYMLSAHQQIEPARPPITSRQARNQGKRASRGQGAWSFARRGRFKIAARVGRIPQRRPGRWLLLWLLVTLALLLLGSCLLLLAARQDARKGSASKRDGAWANGRPRAGLGWARSIPRVELLQGTEWLSPPSRGRFISCGGSRDGPCLANNYWSRWSGARPRVVWFSQSRLHPPEEKACPPGASSSFLVSVARQSCPSSCRPSPPGLPASVSQEPARTCTGPAEVWGVLILPRPGRAWSPARSTKTGAPGWLVDIAVRPAARSRSDPGHHHQGGRVVMSSSQHIQEVSRRARRSHLANERSISTSKGPPPAPAKARLDAMLLLGPCLFPSPPPCSHPFSLTTNC